MKTSIREIDDILHRERITADGKKVTFKANLTVLPDGTFIQLNNQPFLLVRGQVHQWTPSGYGKGMQPPSEDVIVLTPRSTVNAFRAGYVPQMALPGDEPV